LESAEGSTVASLPGSGCKRREKVTKEKKGALKRSG